ncbi:MAG: GNAT family N-acetyltransferase [Candidatus Omnitrophica bacterium]|nr:GNAT family N-acetyltransferase [Candidatus Omnitrophota bacterium]
MEKKEFPVESLEVPVFQKIASELCTFWGNIFGQDFVETQNLFYILAGKERKFNRDFVFIAKHKDSIVSTVHLTISRFDKRIGGIGEVATAAEFRGKGLAKILCNLAISLFEKQGGRYLFLGTNNPAAARLYYSLGWKYVPGSRVMIRSSNDNKDISLFLDGRKKSCNKKINILRGDARFRLQIIPLALFPFDEIVLDINAGLFSTRWFVQKSCMGLYPHYKKIEETGAWFVAISGKNVVGLSSVKLDDNHGAQIDGFCLPEIGEKVMRKLYLKAVDYACKNGANEIHMVADSLDTRKKKLLLKLGCIPQGERIMIESREGLLDIITFRFPLHKGKIC